MQLIPIPTVYFGLLKRNPRALRHAIYDILDHREIGVVSQYIHGIIAGAKQKPLHHQLLVSPRNMTYSVVVLYCEQAVAAWHSGDWCTSTLLGDGLLVPRRWPEHLTLKERSKLRDYTRRSKIYFESEYKQFMTGRDKHDAVASAIPKKPSTIHSAELLRREAGASDTVPASFEVTEQK